MSTVTYTNAEGFVGHGEELDFEDHASEIRSYIIDIVETHLAKVNESHTSLS